MRCSFYERKEISPFFISREGASVERERKEFKERSISFYVVFLVKILEIVREVADEWTWMVGTWGSVGGDPVHTVPGNGGDESVEVV